MLNVQWSALLDPGLSVHQALQQGGAKACKAGRDDCMFLQMMIKTKTTVLNLKSPSYTLVYTFSLPAAADCVVCISAKV